MLDCILLRLLTRDTLAGRQRVAVFVAVCIPVFVTVCLLQRVLQASDYRALLSVVCCYVC